MGLPALFHGLRLGPVLALAGFLAGCASGANDATEGERQELANMPAYLMVPPTRPSTLVKSFRSLCVETPSDPAVRTARLRAADYVPMGGWSGGIRKFVVHDLRPMVILSESGSLCAVRASARAGQTNAILREVERAYPDANRLAASDSYEAAWETAPGQAEVIALIRSPHSAGRNEFTIALMRR